jgi:hypothetical protein
VASIIIPEGIWEPIITGLRENRVIAFEYCGIWDEGYKPRRVRPCQLLFDNGVWYRYGYAEERKTIRMFSLPRMRNAAVASETFALPRDFDYRLKSDDSYFGVFAGAEPQQFAIAFYDESAVWVRERQWAADQDIEETDDDVVVYFSSTPRKHHHIIKRRPSSGTVHLFFQRSCYYSTKLLPVYAGSKPFKGVSDFTQLVEPVIFIKKSFLLFPN